jgi:predicted Zn-ribbon and HTH transcriptional regulator
VNDKFDREQKQKDNDAAAEIAKLVDENSRLKESHLSQPYKCNKCGDRVSYTFILPFIKNSGLCPDCFSKDGEDGN